MYSKFNWRKNILGRKPYTLLNSDAVEVEIISDKAESVNHLLIIDHNGIVISFPKSLVKANDISIENEKMKLSRSVYDTWFKPKLSLEIENISKTIYNNFDRVVNSSDIILRDKEFKNIQLPFLKSTILYKTSISYSLGNLLDSWLYNDDLRLSSSSYMLKLNISPVSGVNNYTAYSSVKKSLFTSSLDCKEKNLGKYLDTFYSFGPQEYNPSELIVLTRLLFELDIN